MEPEVAYGSKKEIQPRVQGRSSEDGQGPKGWFKAGSTGPRYQ
jgi:hypothetical protein